MPKIDWKILVALPAAIVAFVGLWTQLGLPRWAWASELMITNRQQADQAIAIYAEKIERLTYQRKFVAPGSADYDLWKKQFERASKQLESAENRKVELAK